MFVSNLEILPSKKFQFHNLNFLHHQKKEKEKKIIKDELFFLVHLHSYISSTKIWLVVKIVTIMGEIYGLICSQQSFIDLKSLLAMSSLCSVNNMYLSSLT